MSANNLSPRTAWANVRSLPGEVWKRIGIAIGAYIALSVAFSLHFADQMQISGTLLQQMQGMQRLQEQPELSNGLFIGLILLNLVMLLVFYAVNRLVAAHDRREATTTAFLLNGFLGRFLLPIIVAYLAFFVAILLGALVIGVFAALLSAFLPSQVGVVLAVLAAVVLPFAMIYAIIRLTCLLSVIAFEDLSLYGAIKRTWALSAGQFWRIFGVVLALLGMMLACVLAMVLVEVVFSSLFGEGNLSIVVQALHYLVIGPVITVLSFMLPVAIYRVLRDGEAAEAAEA